MQGEYDFENQKNSWERALSNWLRDLESIDLGESGERIELEAGEVLFRQGDSGDGLFVASVASAERAERKRRRGEIVAPELHLNLRTLRRGSRGLADATWAATRTPCAGEH